MMKKHILVYLIKQDLFKHKLSNYTGSKKNIKLGRRLGDIMQIVTKYKSLKYVKTSLAARTHVTGEEIAKFHVFCDFLYLTRFILCKR